MDPTGYVAVLFIVEPSFEQPDTYFGHAALLATSGEQRSSVSQGTPVQLEPSVADFVNEYLEQGRTVTAYVLSEDKERDNALIESIEDSEKRPYDELRRNCATSCGDALRGAGVLRRDQRPERGLVFDSPIRLQESLERGALSSHVETKVIFDPHNVQLVVPEQIVLFLGITDE